MIRVAVIGATGYAGAETVRILSDHPRARISLLTSRQYAGASLADIYPAFNGVVDVRLEEYAPERVADRADVVFIALPHKIPMDIVPALLEKGLNRD